MDEQSAQLLIAAGGFAATLLGVVITQYFNSRGEVRRRRHDSKLEYRWFLNGKIFAGGWNATTKVWGPPAVDSKGYKYVVRVTGTLNGKVSYRFSRTYVVRY